MLVVAFQNDNVDDDDDDDDETKTGPFPNSHCRLDDDGSTMVVAAS